MKTIADLQAKVASQNLRHNIRVTSQTANFASQIAMRYRLIRALYPMAQGAPSPLIVLLFIHDFNIFNRLSFSIININMPLESLFLDIQYRGLPQKPAFSTKRRCHCA